MIFSKKDIQEVLPADVTGRSVAHPKRWLVALVRISHEKKTSERLSKMGIENFLPVQQEVHQWSDRRKVVERVLLPMMIFVHVDMYEQKEVLTLGSISRDMVLRGESIPAVIPDADTIARFNDFCASIFAQQRILEEQNQSLVALRDTLLPKLMSGELDVSALDL